MRRNITDLKLLKFIAFTLSLSFPWSLDAAELARVGESAITSEQVNDALKALGNQGQTVAANPDLKKRFLDHMINSHIVASQAASEGFEKDSRYQARLADMTKQLLAGEYMDRKLDLQMTELGIKKYFDEHKLDFSKKEVRASQIVVATEEEALKLLKDSLKAGAKFNDFAKTKSKDKTVDLGFFTRGRMTTELEKAAFNTPKGEVHPKPVKTMFGWHIIKVTDVRGTDAVQFASLKGEVKVKMRSSLQESMVRSLRDKTKVTVFEENLREVKLH